MPSAEQTAMMEGTDRSTGSRKACTRVPTLQGWIVEKEEGQNWLLEVIYNHLWLGQTADAYL